jgi:hypothetical protein
MARRCLAVGAVLLASGCSGGQGGAEGVGSGGDEPSQECTPQSCEQAALFDVVLLSEPRPLVEYVGASCSSTTAITGTQLGNVSGTACNCAVEQGGTRGIRAVGPVGLGCYVLGRGGDCLWGDDEFQGCNVNDPNLCANVCEELERRQEADAEKSFPAELVYAGCAGNAQAGSGACESVVSIDGRCYANRDYDQTRSYDCALGAARSWSNTRRPRRHPKDR